MQEEHFFRTVGEDLVETARQRGLSLKRPDEMHVYGASELQQDVKELLTLASEAGRPAHLVLLIDEADQLSSYSDLLVDAWRRWLLSNDDVSTVVSAVALRPEKEHPLLSLYDGHELRRLGVDEAKRLMVEPLRGVLKLAPGVVDRVLEITDRKPYLVQRLCLALVDRCYQQGHRTISLQDVELIGEKLVEDRTPSVDHSPKTPYHR